MTAFPDLEVIMDHLVESECPKYHWTLIGANTGPGGTGRSVRISGVEIWTIGKNGLIAESRGSFDSDDYQRQLASFNPGD